jgi:hypothetical protein
MKRRDFVKTAAVVPLAGIPFAVEGSTKKEDSDIKADFPSLSSEELTEEEKAELWEKYKNLVHFCAWKLKNDPYIYGGTINPEKPIWAKQGEWATFVFQGKKISSPHDELVESFRNQIFDAAQWWKNNKQLSLFENPSFEIFIKETIWRHQKEYIENYCEGIDYPDGPWAEGWEERSGHRVSTNEVYENGKWVYENGKWLPVMEFEKDGRPDVHRVEDILRDVPWVPNPGTAKLRMDLRQDYKRTTVYVRQEAAVTDGGDGIAWGEMDLILLDSGWFTINANQNSCRQDFNRRSTFTEELRREKT